ncbi:MAG: MarC family protein [Chroococcidiopsidaceae cyanobacterium CP_BM_RX_35]|nr:MarC family protein [Chroococcidiopsidaceae cyanobacterium CP_BM_RX_35]
MNYWNRIHFRKSKFFTTGAALFLLSGLILTTHIPTLAASQHVSPATSVPPSSLELGPDKIFTYFFVMLGPIKLLAPFVNLTYNTDNSFRRQLAFRAFLFSCIAGVVAALIGQWLLVKWGVSLPALLIAEGIVLFLIALQIVLQQYEPPIKEQSAPSTPSLATAFAPLTFPTIITPYGTAALILLLAARTTRDDFAVLGIFLTIMVINLLAMLFARQILQLVGLTTLRILGAVLGILQVALAIQMLIAAVRLLAANWS